MSNEPTNPSNDDEALDRLLGDVAARADKAQAPSGFADRVMVSIAREDALLTKGTVKSGGSLTFGRALGISAAAAALLFVAFLLGREYGTSNTNDNSGDSKLTSNDGSRGARNFDNREGDPVTIQDLAHDLNAGSPANAKNNGARSGDTASRVGDDRGRPSQTSPSTIAGRFPRSADRRVYVVIDAKNAAASLPAQKAPSGGWKAPSMLGYNWHLLSLPVADAEKLLISIDAKYKSAARAHLAGFSNTLLPVDGVVTPPRVDYTEPTPPAVGDDSIELVIYTQL